MTTLYQVRNDAVIDEMRLMVRPYNAEGPLLLEAINDGFEPAGVVVDASIGMGWQAAVKGTRLSLPPSVEFWLDPVTFKMRSPFFRSKPMTYQRLPYFFTEKLGTEQPRVGRLRSLASEGASSVIQIQSNFTVSKYLSPYFLLEPSDVLDEEHITTFKLWKAWVEALGQRMGRDNYVMSLCVSGDLVADPTAASAVLKFVNQVAPKSIYFIPVGWELGVNVVIDRAMKQFLALLREGGVREITYSHAPFWAGYLRTWGVTAFITGINYLSTMKPEYITRKEEIGGITHNYYVPFRFSKLAPQRAREAISKGIVERCECPACGGRVPSDVNRIRMHYLHAREQEVKELSRSPNKLKILRQWTQDTEVYLARMDEAEIKISSRPTPTQWLSAVEDS